MSPILFALYLNDLYSFLSFRSVNGITVNEISDELLVYLGLLISLYATYTVLFSNSESAFQYSLDVFETYCKNRKYPLMFLTLKLFHLKILDAGYQSLRSVVIL